MGVRGGAAPFCANRFGGQDAHGPGVGVGNGASGPWASRPHRQIQAGRMPSLLWLHKSELRMSMGFEEITGVLF